MDIKEHKATILKVEKITEEHDTIEKILEKTKEKIKFLENIYMGDGKYHHFSEGFNDAAHKERQELCKVTSACYEILRERKI